MLNWKLIFQLSLFGLAMGFATVFWIPSNTEPLFWFPIFITSAYLIARHGPGKYFLHGFLVSIVNSIWITAVHIALYNTYMSHHPEMASMNEGMPMANYPRLMMAIMGPIFGAVSGLILGLFSAIAVRVFRKNPVAN